MKKLKIHFMNTIWSDCILLEYDNHYAFVDTGSSFYYDMIDTYLKENKIKHLDFIIVTHFHHDHYGNAARLFREYEVDKLYLKHYYNVEGSTSAGKESNDDYLITEQKNYEDLLDAAANKIVFIDEIKEEKMIVPFYDVLIELYDLPSHLYNIFNDINGKYYQKHLFNENYNSIAVYVSYNNKHIYLGADIPDTPQEIEEISHMGLKAVRKIKENHHIDHFDLVKSPHHGTIYFVTEDVAGELNAPYVVITNTDRWLDNYHTVELFKRIREDAVILKTDHQKYIFTIDDDISYVSIADESPFYIYGD